MKIIEALKKIKDLQRKADDIKDKIGTYCADLDCENPVYVDQKLQISTCCRCIPTLSRKYSTCVSEFRRLTL